MVYKDYISFLSTSMNLLATHYNELKEKHQDKLNKELSIEDLATYNAMNKVICDIAHDIQDKLEHDLEYKNNERKKTKWIHKEKKANIFQNLGASNHSLTEREINDFYATDPKATEKLLEKENFNHNIWEICCGQGHISEVLKTHGYNVYSTDLIDRGYQDDIIDILEYDACVDCDIITNPPYKCALEIVQKALNITSDGNKIAMLLKIQFLEGIQRKNFLNYIHQNMFMFFLRELTVLKTENLKNIVVVQYAMHGIYG